MPVPHNNCSTLLDTEMHDCLCCSKKVHSLFSELSCDELIILNENKYKVSYKAGETIYKAGTRPVGLLCLYQGKVKISRMGMNGTEQIVALKKPVDFIGFRALMEEKYFLSSAVALEPSSVCIINKDNFFKTIRNNANLALRVIRILARELNELEGRLLNLTQKHVRARLADALLIAHDVYGQSPDDGVLNVSLKRADLAALANMTTANAIRVLSSFAKENVVEIDKRNIKINDLNALNEISVWGR